MADDVSEREQQVGLLLRQLSVGLSAYRLFPGDLGQPGFLAATRRIAGASDKVLSRGLFEAEVTGDTFVIAEGPVAPDEGIERLASACYARRVERIRIRSTPSESDLGALYEVLTKPVDEVLAEGGADALLRRSGVISVALSEMNPQAVQSSSETLDSLRGHPDGAPFHEELTLPAEAVAQLAATPVGMAESLFDRFQAVVGALPPEMGSSIDLYRMLRRSVEALPDEQRRMLHSVLLDRAMRDPLAERYIGTMSDSELARVLVDVAEWSERDPAEMARRVVEQRLRSDDLVELTVALSEGRIEGDTVLARFDGDAGAPGDSRARSGDEAPGDGDVPEISREVYETVGDLLGQSLLAREQEDLGVLRDNFPSTDEEQRETASFAVRDYLVAEQDLERLERVLASWMGTARAALRATDPVLLREALAVLERPRAEAAGEPERSMLFDLYRNQTPEPGILRELVAKAKDPEGQVVVTDLLAPFDQASVVALLDLLAEEHELHERSVIIGLTTELARDHLDVVASRVGDRRVPVVRDAVTVAYRANGPGVRAVLERAGRHPAPDVREEAVRGLIAVAGASAVGRLRDLARDADDRVRALAVAGLGGLVVPAAVEALADVAATSSDPATAKDALDHLARHPSQEARARLRGFASGKAELNLRRPMRRYAKGLLKS